MTNPGMAPVSGQGTGIQVPAVPAGYGHPGGTGRFGGAQWLLLAVCVLGVVGFFLGFATAWELNLPEGADFSAEEVLSGSNWFSYGSVLPGMFLLGGLFALAGLLPGDRRAGLAPAAFALTGALSVMFLMFTNETAVAGIGEVKEIGIGTILMLVFGLLQAIAAVLAFLVESKIIGGMAPVPYGQPAFAHAPVHQVQYAQPVAPVAYPQPAEPAPAAVQQPVGQPMDQSMDTAAQQPPGLGTPPSGQPPQQG